jgi:hypothetical protein
MTPPQVLDKGRSALSEYGIQKGAKLMLMAGMGAGGNLIRLAAAAASGVPPLKQKSAAPSAVALKKVCETVEGGRTVLMLQS